MTARALSAVAGRLALIIPRLASNHDGEVVATARAIGRTLNAAGLDWHDVAAAINAIDPPRPRHQSWGHADDPPPPLWSELRPHDRRAWLDAIDGQPWLSEWEATFVADIRVRFRASQHKGFSGKQQIVLNRLIARAFYAGVRP